jgi:hypothetical protein
VVVLNTPEFPVRNRLNLPSNVQGKFTLPQAFILYNSNMDVMNNHKVELVRDVERLEDPNDRKKVFYRIKLSPKPSREFIEALYDFWNNPNINPNRGKQELLCDYAGNLLIHVSSYENENDILALVREALVYMNRSEASPR